MNELVFLKKDEPFTDSMRIAEATNNQHKSVAAILRKYRKDFEEYGTLRFSDLKSTNPKGGHPTRICEYGFAEGIDFNADKNVRVQMEGGREVKREIEDHNISVERFL